MNKKEERSIGIGRHRVLGVILLLLAGCGGGTASIGGDGNPFPTITAISPTSAVAGSAAGFTLTVNGTNFVSASVVNFAGTGARVCSSNRNRREQGYSVATRRNSATVRDSTL